MRRRGRRYHRCDGCGHAWKDPRPDGCPNCKRGPHWIASFPYPEHAEAHQPLGGAAPSSRSEEAA